MATSGKPDCCPTTLNLATNQWTEYLGTPKEPQNIYLYIFYSHFIYGLNFTCHNLKTERVDGAARLRVILPVIFIIPHLEAQTPSTCCNNPLQKAITTTSMVTCKLCWFLIFPHSLRAVQEQETVVAAPSYQKISTHDERPRPESRTEQTCWGATSGLQDGTEELFLPEGVLWCWHWREQGVLFGVGFTVWHQVCRCFWHLNSRKELRAKLPASWTPKKQQWHRHLTFILSMLASIFSCSTSFLACAMLAVLLLAMGAVGQVSRDPPRRPQHHRSA